MRLKINGEDRVSTSDPLSPLVDVLRDEFFLTGAKPVCREGFCGACLVLKSVDLADGVRQKIAKGRLFCAGACSIG